MPSLDSYDITLKLKGRGEMDKAEDWIADNIKGRWSLEFLGMQEQMNGDTGERSQVLSVRFSFGLNTDLQRFKNEYVDGKPPAPTKPMAKKAPPKKKGMFGWLFD